MSPADEQPDLNVGPPAVPDPIDGAAGPGPEGSSGGEEDAVAQGLSCTARDDLVLLALGVLEGRRRAELIGHVESCPGCAAELGEHVEALDHLLSTAPVIEPPLGFEARVAHRLREDREARAAAKPGAVGFRRRWGLAAAVLALLAAGAAGAGIAAGLGSSGPARQSGRPIVARLVGAGTVRGDVVVGSGRPAWLTVDLEDGTWSGWVTCRVTTRSHRVIDLGGFEVTGGSAVWSVRVALPAAEVASARVLGPDGSLLAEARLGR